MRIGPLEINLSRGGTEAEKLPSPKPVSSSPATLVHEEDPPEPTLGGELGGTGTIVFNSKLLENDYNPQLSEAKRYEIFDQMRMGDGQVKAGMMAIKLPLMRSEWTIEPVDDSTLQREIADHIQHHLIERSKPFSWHQTLYQMLLHLDYGSMPFEIVWEMMDGKVVLERLAPRLPKSVTKWIVNRDGTFGGIEQSVWTGGANNVETVTIPGSKMVLFINDLEGSNFRGISILRAAYPHWFYKNGLYKVDAIAKEKRSIGIDVMRLFGAVDNPRRKSAESALMRLAAHEKQFVTEIDGEHEYRVEGITGTIADALTSIEHHDIRILRSILAEFIAMGEKQAKGSEAEHRDKTSFFIMAMEAIGQQLRDPINYGLIPQWVNMNWPGVKEYPQLVHGHLEKRDMQQLAGAIARLVSVGAIIADEPLEQAIRQRMDLPPLEPGSPRPDIFANDSDLADDDAGSGGSVRRTQEEDGE